MLPVVDTDKLSMQHESRPVKNIHARSRKHKKQPELWTANKTRYVRQDEEKYVSIQGEHSHMKTAARLDGNEKKSMFLIVVYATYVECYFIVLCNCFLFSIFTVEDKTKVSCLVPRS